MKLSSAKIVVAGALTVTGRDILNILAEQGADRKNIMALETGRIKGDTVAFGDEHALDVRMMEGFDFTGVDIVLHAGNDRDAVTLASAAVKTGVLFVDASGAFALDPDVPVVVPEVNGAVLEERPKRGIVASPTSIATFLALALNPVHRHAPITRIVASTYQAVSHWGREAQDELFSQTKAMFMAQSVKSKIFPKQIAFNCYPLLGVEREDGTTDVEGQTIAQVKKILGTKIRIAVNTVTVPCFVGDGMMVNVECATEITPIKAAMWMTAQKGLGVIDDDSFCTHADIASEDTTYVSRLRADVSVDNGISFWLMGDNLRKGSAMNMVQIAEMYLKSKN